MSGFAAGVSGWAAQTKERIKAVRIEAAQRVVEIMQVPVGEGGNMPVRDGFLRASLVATTGPAPLPNIPKPPKPKDQEDQEVGVKYPYDGSAVNLVIVMAGMSDAISLAYTAEYARHVNYGARGRPARLFVDLAAQQWPRIVTEVVQEVNARAR